MLKKVSAMTNQYTSPFSTTRQHSEEEYEL